MLLMYFNFRHSALNIAVSQFSHVRSPLSYTINPTLGHLSITLHRFFSWPGFFHTPCSAHVLQEVRMDEKFWMEIVDAASVYNQRRRTRFHASIHLSIYLFIHLCPVYDVRVAAEEFPECFKADIGKMPAISQSPQPTKEKLHHLFLWKCPFFDAED